MSTNQLVDGAVFDVGPPENKFLYTVYLYFEVITGFHSNFFFNRNILNEYSLYFIYLFLNN
jgi:hypothetical protein